MHYLFTSLHLCIQMFNVLLWKNFVYIKKWWCWLYWHILLAATNIANELNPYPDIFIVSYIGYDLKYLFIREIWNNVYLYLKNSRVDWLRLLIKYEMFKTAYPKITGQLAVMQAMKMKNELVDNVFAMHVRDRNKGIHIPCNGKSSANRQGKENTSIYEITSWLCGHYLLLV